jgi:hypothetical protein
VAWFPGAIRKEITRHRTPRTRDRGICNHIAVSEAASLFNYFNQPGNPTSHFYVRYDGDVEQYVDTQFRAPANLKGNPTMISIETQGGKIAGQKWTAAQLETLAQIAAWCHQVHGIPLQAMPNSRPESIGIGYHRLGIDPWRVPDGELWSMSYGKTCPEEQRIAQQPYIITRARVIAAGTPEEDMPMTDAQAAALLTAAETSAKSCEEIAQLFRTHAIRMDNLVNHQMPDLRADAEAIKLSTAAIVENTTPAPKV